MPQYTTDDAARFWANVDTSGDCWLWRASKDKDGYGHFRVHGQHIRAHRFSYILAHSFIPARLIVCHRCDNPSCVNPSHLLLGTHTDNIADRDAKKRTAKGDRNGYAKIAAEAIPAIRKRYANGETQTALAIEYGVTQSAISRIIHHETWHHIE